MTAAEQSAPDATTEAILDATRAAVLDFGIRRATLTDIARRAGVSRMTVYRRYPDVDAVLRDLMTREFGTLLEELAARVDGRDGRRRVVARLSTVVRELRGAPLLRKVLEAEPELLLPYLFARMGETQRHGVAMVRADIAAGQREGSIRAGDPAVLAQSLLLVTQSFVFSAGIAEDVSEEALLAEFERLVEAALQPDG